MTHALITAALTHFSCGHHFAGGRMVATVLHPSRNVWTVKIGCFRK